MAIEAWRIALKYMTPVSTCPTATSPTAPSRGRSSRHRRPADIASENGTERQPSSRTCATETTLARRGPSRHAGPRAPHRRPREGGHHRQRQLRPGQPPPDAAAAPEKVAGIANDIPPLEVNGPRRATCSCSAGAAPTARSRTAVERLQGEGQESSPTPTSATSTPSREHRRGARALQEGADPGAEPRPAALLIRREVPGRRRSASTRSRASRSWSPRSRKIDAPAVALGRRPDDRQATWPRTLAAAVTNG